ncbi:hypothetical protein HYPSUDRAFT_34186 [Hypholoma sublateritium FD-334 SS-4]|uniref:Uncharacterized protein n=1 Tax=Hypholoma sublateritium (strain FD-334 SS-4) TaxID=945553 RepID=A0A0D2MVB7_HYPSF|nr:hypothetical protein HYPSUDRAFT_34186 [Hypholoma sublateritium FD-334 SS-4]
MDHGARALDASPRYAFSTRAYYPPIPLYLFRATFSRENPYKRIRCMSARKVSASEK